MASIPVVDFSLSQEELLFLLRVFNLPALPGLDLSPLNQLASAERDLMLVAGENGLRARGLVQSGSGEGTELAAGDLLLAALGTCVMGNAVIALSRKPVATGRGDSRGFYFGPEIMVEYEAFNAGIHRFTCHFDLASSLRRVVNLAGFDLRARGGDTPKVEPVRVPRAALDRTRDQATTDPSGAAALTTLQSTGVPLLLAASLAICLAQLESVVTLTLVSFKDGGVSGHAVVLLKGEKSAWLLDPGEEENGPVTCWPATGEDVEAWLRAALPPLETPSRG